MKIILRKDVERLGKRGEIIEVKGGYARNYLIPKGLAYPATDSYIRIFQEEEKIKKMKEMKKERDALKMKKQLEKVSLTVKVKASEDGKLFGSVSTKQIEELLQEKGFKIDKHNILIEEPIKEVGVYTIKVKLHPKVIANLKIWVVSEEG